MINNNEVKSIVIANGDAVVINSYDEMVNSSSGVLRDNKIFVPNRSVDLSQTRDILIDSGVIRFEGNDALLNFVIQKSMNRTIMPLLGIVAEAIIVKRCFVSEEVKYKLFCIATGKRARKETSKQFEACGTSLISTKIGHLRHHHNPGDKQRDVIFINASNIPALMSNATAVAGECAGLQVKTSNDIVSYIFKDIVNGRYCVPIICFPLMSFPNIFSNYKETITSMDVHVLLMNKILNNKDYIGKLLKNNHNYFSNYLSTNEIFEERLYDFLKRIIHDIKDIDVEAFEELLYIKEVLELLANGRISPNDLLNESDQFIFFAIRFMYNTR